MEDKSILEFFDVDYDHIRTDDFSPATLQALEMINRKVAAHESLDALMNFVFDSTIRICHCDRIWLAFVQEGGQRAVAKWVRATYSPLLLDKGYTADIRKSYLRKVVEERKVCLIHDLRGYLAENPDITSTKLLVEEGVRSSMTAPLLMGGRTVALLFRSSRNPNAFSEKNVRQNLATVERISQAVNMAYKMDELGEAIHSYMEMLGFISHELKSPLSSIIMDGRLVAEGYLGPLEPKQGEKIERINAKAEYLLSLVREYLDLARIEGGQLEVTLRKNVDIGADVIEPAIELLKNQLEAKQMTLSWEHPPSPLLVEVDRQLLRIVMVNLLGNAIKYGFERSEIRLTTKLADGDLEVSVWNEGFGFLEKQKPLLFKKFSRLEPTNGQKTRGTGVGLFTCWKIIRLHGGTIQGESQHGQWARFTFNIPQPPRISVGLYSASETKE
jgi:signal transduction histidine kinase